MATYWLSLTDAVDPAWWEPLMRFAAMAAGLGLPVVDVDDFVYSAHVDRPGLPVLHVYRHLHTRKYLNIDAAGTAWRYVGPGRGSEGYEQLDDPSDAIGRAEIERGNHLATHTRAKCEDAWLAALIQADTDLASTPPPDNGPHDYADGAPAVEPTAAIVG